MHVVRERVAQVRWLGLASDEMVFVFPQDEVTQEGADALQQGWAHFIDKGLWAPVPGHRAARPTILARYTRSERLGPEVPAVIRSRWHVVVGVLSAVHFTAQAVAGLNFAVADCIAVSGWEYRGQMRASA